MKAELNNIVVEKPKSRKEAKEIKKAFKELGYKNEYINWDDYNYYFGILDNELDGVLDLEDYENAKIITLEQLKAMKPKEDVYPKLMYVADEFEIELNKKEKERIVFFEDKYGFWGKAHNDSSVAHLYKYAQDIEPETLEEKDVIELNIPNLENVTVKINGKEIKCK